MINLIANGASTKIVSASNITLAVFGTFGGGAVTVDVSYDDGTNWIPVEESGTPISITDNSYKNLAINGRKKIRFTLAGATAPNININIA